MSLFGKMKAGLKSVTNRVTGGYGEVSLELDEGPFLPGQSVTGRITVTATEDLKVTKITAKLRSVEGTNFNDEYEPGVHAKAFFHETTCEQDIELCGEAEIPAGETRDFEAVFQLPEDAKPSLRTDHMKHIYTVSTEVDIPWGKDLRAREDICVATAPPSGEPPQLKLVQQNRSCKAMLTVPNARVEAGDSLQFTFVVAPQGPLEVERLMIGIKAVEVMGAELTYRSLDPDFVDEDGDGELDMQYEKEHNLIEITAYEDYSMFLHQTLVEENTPIFNTLGIPHKMGGSYRGQENSHRVYIVAILQLADGEALTFQDEILVIGNPQEQMM